jgi:NAD-dependent SIR2 family protein deacetylase
VTAPDWLAAARQVTVPTGAGISTESGIPGGGDVIDAAVRPPWPT